MIGWREPGPRLPMKKKHQVYDEGYGSREEEGDAVETANADVEGTDKAIKMANEDVEDGNKVMKKEEALANDDYVAAMEED